MGDTADAGKMTIARRRIEERYGKIGTGGKILFVGGIPMGLSTLSRRLALRYADLVPIDCGTLPDGTHWIRYYDGDMRKVLAIEFDDGFEFRGEHGADIMDWLGDDYFRIHWRVFCPAGGEEWLGADAAKGR